MKIKMKNMILSILIFTFALSVLGIVNSTNKVSASTCPKITGIQVTNKNPLEGDYPTIKINSKGSGLVQYSIYQYSKENKKWKNISNGYTKTVKGNTSYTMKLTSALHKGDNEFSVRVKKAQGKSTNKSGYDHSKSFSINVKGTSHKIEASSVLPSIKSASISKSQQIEGKYPTLQVNSKGKGKVKYSVYLYSPIKKTWENVSKGYTSSVEVNTFANIKLTKPLHKGENIFSIWVKRAGNISTSKNGYDNSLTYKINIQSSNNETVKISNVTYDKNLAYKGANPKLTITGKTKDKTGISYKTFIYSESNKKWVTSSEFTEPVLSGEAKKVQLDASLNEGNNRILIWAKRALVSGEVYEDSKVIEINVKKQESIEKRIVIDPGHGGHDSGATSSSGSKERDIALSVSLKLGDILKSNGFHVLYTREDNENVNWNSYDQRDSLRYRSNFANSNDADIFVAIHCNSNNEGAPGSGTETYYSKKKSDKDKMLATFIQQELIKSTKFRDRGAKPGNLWVVNNTKMPAALVELGFINNIDEETKLNNSDFQQEVAQGIANGILKYWNR